MVIVRVLLAWTDNVPRGRRVCKLVLSSLAPTINATDTVIVFDNVRTASSNKFKCDILASSVAINHVKLLTVGEALAGRSNRGSSYGDIRLLTIQRFLLYFLNPRLDFPRFPFFIDPLLGANLLTLI